jgi:hypothetical protein
VVSGCSTNQSKINASVKAIEEEKKAAASSNVSFSVSNPRFQIVLDKDDRILSICNVSQGCDGLSDINHEVIEISSNGIGLGGYGEYETMCGTSWFKNNNYKRACNSKFYKTSGYYMAARVGGAVVSAGIITLMMWTVHDESFDSKSLYEATNNARLHDLQTLLFATATKINSRGAISVVYIDVDHIDDVYKGIRNNPVGADSVVFIDGDTKKPLYVLSFSDFQEKELPVAVNLQLTDLMSALAGRSVTSMDATGLDVKRLIPPDVLAPDLPPVPKLTKDEFETKAAFNKRVENAVAEREDAIRRLQQEYKRDVYNRNQYIEAVGEYLDSKATKQNELDRELKKNQTRLARLLYAMNMGKFTASEMSYDAESKSLYFTATSARYGFKQKMLAKVSAPLAQSIKETGKYTLTPKLVNQDGKIKMEELILAETTSGDDFATSYTDINFTPEFVSVKVATSSNKKSSATLKSYEQKPQAIVDASTKEVWYIDTVNRINAKIPNWYATPEISKNVIGYGDGNSHEEAMDNARKELAYTVKTSISGSMDILQQDNTFRSYQDVTRRTRAATDVILKAGDYSVYKQTELDGKYYVALCYRCNTN